MEATTADANPTADGFTYEVKDDQSVIITGYTGKDENVTIPSTINGLAVKEIGNNAFKNNKTIKSITIPDGVTSIGRQAFYECANLGSITIPNSVTSIGIEAFFQCGSLTSIEIPNSVTSIGKEAFFGCGLTSITIPSSIERIEDGTFASCHNLANVTIPNSVTSIGKSAFESCRSLTSITIPDSVTSIGESAFYHCNGLTSITIPDSVTSIGESAFYNCNGLTSITIPSNIERIENSTFASCDNLANVTIPNSVTSIGESAFAGCSFTSITIPGSVKSIGKLAFNGNESLTSIEISEGVESIGLSAFIGCSKLASVTFPSSMTSIGEQAFYSCDGLTSIKILGNVTSIGKSTFYECENLSNIEIPSSVTSIGDSAFYKCTNLKNINIPNGVTSIGRNAFAVCSSLTDIKIPNSVTSIGPLAFDGCSSLTSIIIPGTIETIQYNSFSYCTNLTKVIICEGVKDIKRDAFNDCGIKEIVIPSTITVIGEYNIGGSFDNNNIENVYYAGSEADWKKLKTEFSGATIHYNYKLPSTYTVSFDSQGGSAVGSITVQSEESFTLPSEPTREGYEFKGWFTQADGKGEEFTTSTKVTGNMTVYASWQKQGEEKPTPNPKEDFTYQWVTVDNNTVIKITGYKGTATEVVIPEAIDNLPVAIIGNGAFSNLSITGITMPNSITMIENNAFYACNLIQTVTIPDNVGSIGNSAFSKCINIQTLTIGKRVTSIGASAFDGCANIRELVIPEHVVSVGNSAFSGCQKIAALTIGQDVKTIGERAFYNCSTLTSVTIPGKVETIGRNAFFGCNNLSTLILGENVKIIDSYAFQNCKKITSLTIPGSVTSIGQYAFNDCSGITSLTIPGNVTSIGYSAFNGCSGITSLKIQEGVKTIDDNAFYGCSSITSLEIPKSVTSIGSKAFQGCTNLTKLTISEGVRYVEYRAFQNCTKLSSVKIPGTMTTIASGTFSGCKNLIKVIISEKVTKIDSGAFDGCSNLKELVIPNTMSYIDNAFSGCNSLTDVYYAGSEEEWKGVTIYLYGNDELKKATIHYNSTASNTYFVSFDSQGGSAVSPITGISSGATVTLPEEPIKAGYEFKGWFTELNGKGTEFTSSTKVTEDLVVYAYWKKEGGEEPDPGPEPNPPEGAFTISFDSQGGSSVDSITVQPGKSFTLPTEPTREGFQFQGWYTGLAGQGTKLTSSTVIDKDLTVYAYWVIGEIPDVPADQVWIQEIPDQIYTGKAIQPDVKVYRGKTLLLPKTDYTISFQNNVKTNGGKSPTVTVKLKTKPVKKLTKTFRIVPKDLSEEEVRAENLSLAYNKKKVQKPVPVLKYKGKKLSNNKDFTVSYPDKQSGAYQNIGTYQVLVKGKGNFTGERTLTLSISDKTLVNKLKVTKIPKQAYQEGREIKPALTVKYKSTQLQEGKDYQVSYYDNKEIGTAEAVIKGMGDYVGEKTISFQIIGESIKKVRVEGISSKVSYTGEEIRPQVKLISDAKGELKEGKDYTVRYECNRDKGGATIVFTGIGAYSGELKKRFTIVAYDIETDPDKKISVEMGKDSASSSSSLIVSYRGEVLEKKEDYTIKYTKQKEVSMVTIKGKGNFKGTIKMTL